MKPVDEGVKGFYKNLGNPYRAGNHNYREWERGFNKAYFENLRKIEDEDRKRG